MAATRRSSRLHQALEPTQLTPLKLDSLRTGEKRKWTPDDAEEAVDVDLPPGTDKKAKKTRQPKSEPVYIIPDVSHKETTYKGRLGS